MIVPPRRPPLAAACAAAALLLGAAPADAQRPTVRLPASQTTIEEGDGATLYLDRGAPAAAPLDVRLTVGGDATAGADYAVTGAVPEDGALRLAIPAGAARAEVAIRVLVDPDPEPAESIELRLADAPGFTTDPRARRVTLTLRENGFAVTTTADSGVGSLRRAIVRANAAAGPQSIRFASNDRLFDPPRTIRLASPLPALTGEIVIDGFIPNRLWQATGVTVSGENRFRVFEIAPGARVTLRSLTIAEGMAGTGGGVLNQGDLTVEGVTFDHNTAARAGGALANDGGAAYVVNSTFAYNAAVERGGGAANAAGALAVVNSTLAHNVAPAGGALHNAGTLDLRNAILAHSSPAEDCVSTGALAPATTHNLIGRHRGCGAPLTDADPRLGAFGRYNGPVEVFPLRVDSSALNAGDNAAAVDRDGAPLIWDQRGNGDPRFVSGITDIGAFETQVATVLKVDRADDADARRCVRARTGHCSLRGALTLSNAMRRGRHAITFDPRAFAAPPALALGRPLPRIEKPTTLDARAVGGATLRPRGDFAALSCAPGVALTLYRVTVTGPAPKNCDSAAAKAPAITKK